MSLLTSLSAAYELDGNSTRAFGTSNGSDTNVSYVAAKFSSGASFNGSTSTLTIADSADWTFGSADFSFSCWVKFNAAGVRYIFAGQSNGVGATASISFVLDRLANNTVRAIVGVGSTAFIPNSVGTITDTTIFHHIVLVRDGGTLRLYIDNVADGTDPTIGSSTVNNSSETMNIGGAGTLGTLRLNGVMDRCYWWKRKLTVAEIGQLYNGLAYPFPESSGFFMMM